MVICERGLAEDLAKRCNCACTDPTHLNGSAQPTLTFNG